MPNDVSFKLNKEQTERLKELLKTINDQLNEIYDEAELRHKKMVDYFEETILRHAKDLRFWLSAMGQKDYPVLRNSDPVEVRASAEKLVKGAYEARRKKTGYWKEFTPILDDVFSDIPEEVDVYRSELIQACVKSMTLYAFYDHQ